MFLLLFVFSFNFFCSFFSFLFRFVVVVFRPDITVMVDWA